MNPTEARLALFRCGYLPIPVQGKVPVMTEWQKHTQTSAEEIELWARVYSLAANTGILCQNTPTLDVDILDPAAAEAVEMLARERFEEHGNILVRIGKAPKRAILFQCKEAFSKIVANVIAPSGSEQRDRASGQWPASCC